MRHPTFSGNGFRNYLLIWVVTIAIHSLVMYFYYGFGAWISLTDGLICNALFAAIGLGFWYVVAFASLSKDELSLIGLHLGTAALTIALWSAISGILLQWIFSNNTGYQRFLSESYFWRIIIGVMYYSITVLIFYLIKYYQDMQQRLNRELELQSLLKDSELRMLKSQINPHFIFNSLNSISALTISKADQAREMVVKLSDFLRYSLGKNSTEMNTLEEEVKNVTLYLDIEKVRFGSKLRFEKDVDKTCLKIKVPNLILQPIFENAIKYGVYDSTKQSSIKMVCHSNERLLTISITNSFDKDAISKKGEGIGLENVKRRLSLVYDRSDLLAVKKSEDEFEVVLKIPKIVPAHE